MICRGIDFGTAYKTYQNLSATLFWWSCSCGQDAIGTAVRDLDRTRRNRDLTVPLLGFAYNLATGFEIRAQKHTKTV